MPRLAWLLFSAGLVGPLVLAGCARSERRITPTTTGSDFQNLPRGRMTPLPFPGVDLARTTAATAIDPIPPSVSPKLDPATRTTASTR